MRITQLLRITLPLIAVIAAQAACGPTAKTGADSSPLPRVQAPPGPTWRARCAALMEQTRVQLLPRIPALSAGHVHVTRNPETVVRMEARVSEGAYYSVTISEPSPNSDFDSDIREEPWQDVRTRMRPMPPTVVALSRLHDDRHAQIMADGVPADAAQALAREMQPVAEECLRLAEHVVSHDHYFVGSIASINAWSADATDVIRVDDAPREIVTMRVEEADKGGPFAKGSQQRFAVESAAPFRELAAQRRSYWFRTDVESGVTTFALARTISMIDDDDRCPDPPPDAGARSDAGLDEDGCP